VWSLSESNPAENWINEYYELKAKKDEDAKIYKKILNCVYGKSLKKFKTEKIKTFENDDDFNKYIYRHHCLIKSHNKSKREIKIEKCFDNSFNHCHLGVRILSQARRLMNALFALCDDLYIKVYISVCDSILIKYNDLSKLQHLMGSSLGELHVETTSEEAIIINKAAYYLSPNHFRFPGKSLAGIDDKKQYYLSLL
jgi:hypothetical protein